MGNLVHRYWGPQNPATAIPDTAPELVQIAQIAYNSGRFTAGAYEDANEFYDFLLDNLTNPTNFPAAWNEQFDTLYRVELQSRLRCNACSNVRPAPSTQNPGLAMTITDQTTDLDDVLSDFLTSSVQTNCPACGPNRPHTQTQQIEAAPMILKLTLLIFGFSPPLWLMTKNYHAIQLFEELDLTRHQVNSALPLRYNLSSIISHSGTGEDLGSGVADGHYIASVKGPEKTWCISDAARETLTLTQFLQNPQRPQTFSAHATGFQVYTLTYLRTVTKKDAALASLAL